MNPYVRSFFIPAMLGALAPVVGAAERLAEAELEPVVVTAVLRPAPAEQLPQSVTELDSARLEKSGVQHFADVLSLVPNLSAAGGTSRPRYFQLRGIGEQEQYQGAPNPSVGFLIDGIDFSGVGMPATLFDVQAIDVLRGPQGSAYGANALAGLISVQTRDPLSGAGGEAEVTAGDHATRSAGVALGQAESLGGANSRVGWRLVAQQYKGDGFRHNAFLNRDDTNGYDETTLRGRLALQASADFRADLTLMHVNLDNGYDGWSIDNSRITQSDKPGRDAQRSDGAALVLQWRLAELGELRSLTSVADSNILFSFDGDWGNDAFWAKQPDCRPNPSLCVPYDFTSSTHRTRRTVAQDLRLTGDADHRIAGRASWLVGLYTLRLSEGNDQLDLYNGAVYTQLGSRYRARNTAVYGQLDMPLDGPWALSAGLRGEQRQAHYNDTDTVAFNPTDRMWGGNLSLSRERTPQSHDYLTLARGFRAGGFNIGASLPPSRRQFRPEYLWNLELGHKQRSTDGRWNWQADVFYMRRVDQQVSSSVQVDPTDPLTYEYYTDNAARGENYGLEAEGGLQVDPHWHVGASLGLLGTRYIDFAYNMVTYDAAFNPHVERRDLSGRAQEYAAPWQGSLSVDYEHASKLALANGGFAKWQLHVDAARSAGYYFSASHDQRAAPHGSINLRARLVATRWDASLWVRNLFNQDSALHGFYFGNEPPDFANKLYLERGDTRQIGLSLRYHFPEL
jgi:outer membrane receptor protein involved in Fe transport